LKRRQNIQEEPVKEKILREHLVDLLSGRGAHVDWKASFNGVPPKLRGVRPNGLPYSIWELLEHMRIAQWDILEFSRDAKHVSPAWPAGYWPAAQLREALLVADHNAYHLGQVLTVRRTLGNWK
jgi:hypothetical protein